MNGVYEVVTAACEGCVIHLAEREIAKEVVEQGKVRKFIEVADTCYGMDEVMTGRRTKVRFCPALMLLTALGELDLPRSIRDIDEIV